MAAHVAGGRDGWKPTRAHLVGNAWRYGGARLTVVAAIKLQKLPIRQPRADEGRSADAARPLLPGAPRRSCDGRQ